MRQRYGFRVLGVLAGLLVALPAALAGDIAFGRAEVRIGTAAGVRSTGMRGSARLRGFWRRTRTRSKPAAMQRRSRNCAGRKARSRAAGRRAIAMQAGLPRRRPAPAKAGGVRDKITFPNPDYHRSPLKAIGNENKTLISQLLAVAVTSVAGGRRSDLPDWTIMGMGTDLKSCSDVESKRTRVPACTFHANAMNQSALPAHPRAGSCLVIGESRGRASPGDDIAHGRSARNRVQYRVIRRMCLIIIG